MKCDISAAIGFEEFNSLAGEEVARGNDVLHTGVAAERDHRWMLEQQQRVSGAACFDQMDERVLQI